MSVEVAVGGNNEWNFLESETAPDYDNTIPLPESPSPVEQPVSLTERLLGLGQELNNAQERFDQCIMQHITSGTLGQMIDDNEFQAAKNNLNRLAPEWRALLAEQLHSVSQELSEAQTRYDHCILRRIAASALGQTIDDSEFQAAKEDINRLAPERLACISALRSANQTIRHHGIDTYELSVNLAQVGYQNPALNDQHDGLSDLRSSLADLLTEGLAEPRAEYRLN
jgi:hypothetical protein